MTTYIHPTALVEPGVEVGAGTAIWDGAHIRAPASIGRECIIGGKAYVAYGVELGDQVKVNAFAYICTGVTIERGVMIAAGVVFTNDRYPRAATPDFTGLRGSAPDEHTRPTRVCEGATIGARAVIGCDLRIGRFAMVGMGSVVTRSVPDYHLVVGHPAASVGVVCRCGEPFLRFRQGDRTPYEATPKWPLACHACGRAYAVHQGGIVEVCSEAVA